MVSNFDGLLVARLARSARRRGRRSCRRALTRERTGRWTFNAWRRQTNEPKSSQHGNQFTLKLRARARRRRRRRQEAAARDSQAERERKALRLAHIRDMTLQVPRAAPRRAARRARRAKPGLRFVCALLLSGSAIGVSDCWQV